MSPIKILIIVILIYIAILLIRGGRKKKEIPKHPDPGQEQPSSDVLVEDPVCGSLVPQQQAIQLQYEGKMVSFCSDECCKKFMKEKNL